MQARLRGNDTSAQPVPPRPRNARVSSLLDPRLRDQRIKQEPCPTPPPFLDGSHSHRSLTPHLQYWASASPASFADSGLDSDVFNFSLENNGQRRLSSSLLTGSAIADDEEDTSVGESSKLKGVLWPGMDIFDSATTEMRRRRNQKKDVSVLEQLEQNSQLVEPTEMIFTPLGSLKRQRRISGSVYDDSSPLKSDTSPRRMTVRRPVLADLDANQNRRNRQQNAPPARRGRPRAVRPNDEDEYLTSIRNVGRPKKKPFEVFQDQEVSFENPAAFSYLTAEFNYPHHLNSVQAYPTQPQEGIFQDQKENIDPFHCSLPRQQRQQHQQMQPYFALSNNAFSACFEAFQGHQPTGFYPNPSFFDAYYQSNPDFDDGRTITAPPSDT